MHSSTVISHFDAVRYFIQVKEHLEIFAILKGVQEDFLNSVVIDMVDQVSSFCITGFLHVLFTLLFNFYQLYLPKSYRVPFISSDIL